MRNRIIVEKMLGYIDRILSYCSEKDYTAFISDTILTEACVFNLSQLGELATKLDSDYTAEHSDIPWNEMRGLRNRIVHDYEGVKLILVWEIISEDLPILKEKLSLLKK